MVEAALRPRRLAEFPGQPRVRDQLGLVLEAARRRGSPPDHVLLSGPPGLGKTTLAMIVAAELDRPIRVTSGPAIQHAGDLAAVLSSLDEGEVLFLDEIHRMSRPAEEMLYLAMEDFRVDVIVGKGPGATAIPLELPAFTVVGATTRAGLLPAPLRDRFGFTGHLDYYDVADLVTILRRSARLLDVDADEAGIGEIAGRSRGTPRIANRLLRRVRDWAQVHGEGHVDHEAARAALALFDVDDAGLDRLDRAVLEALCGRFGGGPVGLSTLAIAVGEEADTVETVAEPYLVREGYVVRTPRGRSAAAARVAPSRADASGPGPAAGPPAAGERPRLRTGTGHQRALRPLSPWALAAGRSRWCPRKDSPRLHSRPGASGPNHCLPRAGNLTPKDRSHPCSPAPAASATCSSCCSRSSCSSSSSSASAGEPSRSRPSRARWQWGRRSSRPPGSTGRSSSSTPPWSRSTRGTAPRCASTVAPSACARPRSAEDVGATAAGQRQTCPHGPPVLILALTGLLAGAYYWSTAQLSPKLGLDLEGGTQIILEPQTTAGQSVSAEQLNQARDIIVQRVDAGGVSGAEVTTQGDRNIVVSIPEIPTQEVRDAISRSSQLQFRPVLAVAARRSPADAVAERYGHRLPEPVAVGVAHPDDREQRLADEQQRGSRGADRGDPVAEHGGHPVAEPVPQREPLPTASPPAGASAPKDPTDLAWITPELTEEFQTLDCSDPAALEGLVDDPAKPLVTCEVDGTAKYILGPVAVSGDKISDATSGYRTNQQGAVTSEVEIALTLDGEGARQYADISRTMVALPEPQNQLAATLDSRVIVAPRFNEAILDGRASITGGLHHRRGPRPLRPAEVRRAPTVLRGADEHRHQPHARQRAAALRPRSPASSGSSSSSSTR